jgi:hypothetical protein
MHDRKCRTTALQRQAAALSDDFIGVGFASGFTPER